MQDVIWQQKGLLIGGSGSKSMASFASIMDYGFVASDLARVMGEDYDFCCWESPVGLLELCSVAFGDGVG